MSFYDATKFVVIMVKSNVSSWAFEDDEEMLQIFYFKLLNGEACKHGMLVLPPCMYKAKLVCF